jgi:hypothetical protein
VTKYLIAALVIAAISVATAALILSGLYGLNPFGLSIVRGAAEARSVSDRAAVASAIAAASAAVSTVFALVVGAIAIIAIIIADRSETKSVEQLKLDFAALGSTLLFLRDRAKVYKDKDPDLVNVDLDPFKAERQTLSRILTSSTGLALYVWSKDTKDKQYDDLWSSLADLVDVTTLDLHKHFQPVANLILERSAEILRRLVSIKPRQFKSMAANLSRIGLGLVIASPALVVATFATPDQDVSAATDAGFRAPTEAELTRLKQIAAEKIGGKSAEVIEHFGRAAIEGTAGDRRRFHSLVSQLLGLDLDDLGSVDA